MAADSSSFLPADDPALSVDERFAVAESLIDDDTLANLDDDDVVVAEEPSYPLGRSWAFDFQARQFVGGRGPLGTIGLATLRGWIEKCLMTERDAHPIHPPGYGLEGLEDFIGSPLDTPVSGLQAAVHDALLFHPAITDVTDFTVYTDEDAEALFMSFTVLTDGLDDLLIDELRLGG